MFFIAKSHVKPECDGKKKDNKGKTRIHSRCFPTLLVFGREATKRLLFWVIFFRAKTTPPVISPDRKRLWDSDYSWENLEQIPVRRILFGLSLKADFSKGPSRSNKKVPNTISCFKRTFFHSELQQK